MKNSKLPDHADRRKTSNDAKRALLEKIKAKQADKSASAKAEKTSE